MESNRQQIRLEEPEEYEDSDDDEDLLNIPKLPNLKHLRVTHKFLNIFIEKVTNLTNFYVGEPQGGTDKTKNITYFINQQKNLEKFCFTSEDHGLKKYTMYLSREIKFKFKSFSCDRECENFVELCKLLADDLDGMYLYFQPDPSLYDVLKKFKKLKNLRLPIRPSDDLFTPSYTGWELRSLENFNPVLDVKLSSLLSRFPNIKHIQCTHFLKDSGVFETIETIDVDYFDPKILETVSFPNWKSLIVNNSVFEDNWNQILAVIPNIETKLMKGFKTVVLKQN
ncbi:hypothetical protein ACKWTF_014732 [Chironomus riparius]